MSTRLVQRTERKRIGRTAKTFAKARWLQYNDRGKDCYEVSSLEGQDELLDRRRSPASSDEIEMNSNVATNLGNQV